MPKYLIERDIPGAGQLTAEELQVISQRSCAVLNTMGPQIKWLHSYVTDDRVYCLYVAASETQVHEHAAQGGFPVSRVAEVRSIIAPTTTAG